MMTIARVAERATVSRYHAFDALPPEASAPIWRSLADSRSQLNDDMGSAALLIPVLLVGSLLTEWAWAQAINIPLTVRFNVMAASFALLFALTIPAALLYLQLVLRPDGPALAIGIGLVTALVAAFPFASDIRGSVPNLGLALALGVEVVAASVALHYVRIAMTEDESPPSDFDFLDDRRILDRF
jgi:uncharacterized membrane protein